jgi:multidrug efflux pump subunit AcrA (membrane-fusion protein)
MRNWAFILIAAACLGADSERQDKLLDVDWVQITLIDEVELAAREPGQVVQLSVVEGQLVKEDELLAQIDDTEPQILKRRAQVEAAIAKRQASNDVKVRFARKSHEVAQAELQRAKESVEKFAKSVSETELDRLRLAAERTLLEVEQAEHDQQVAALTYDLKQTEVDVAERSIDRKKVVSPLTGMIVELKRRRGEWVQPGDVVARLVRIDRVRAEGFVPANQVTPDLLGSPAKLEIDLPGKPKSEFTGKIAFVSPEVNPVNGEVRIWAEIENRDFLLRPGLKAKLTIAKPVTDSDKTEKTAADEKEADEDKAAHKAPDKVEDSQGPKS